MFKLKVPKHKRNALKEQLKIVDSAVYDYVLTTETDQVEAGKINIVFDEEHIDKINNLLDAIVKGEDTFVSVFNEIGQKNIEARLIQYFIVEADDVIAVSGKTRFIVKMKLYELEEMLEHKQFIRISKYAIVNINKIDYIKPALNSKLILQMKNGDEVEVNRHYYKAFKHTLRV